MGYMKNGKATNSTNIFNNFAFEFFDAVLSYSGKPKRLGIFNKKQEQDYGNIKLTYSVLSQLWDDGISFSKWIHLVEQYSKFLRLMEKCFMYKNESSVDKEKYNYIIYSEYNNDEKTEILYFRFLQKDIKVRIKFKSSMINDITVDEETNFIKEYIEGREPSVEQYITFVNVFICRDYGKQLCNEFNFIDNEEPIYKDYTDEMLMDIIRKLLSEAMKQTFINICNENITEAVSVNKSIYDDKLYIGDIISGL